MRPLYLKVILFDHYLFYLLIVEINYTHITFYKN